MTFPAEMRVDYVRVYQRKGQTNIGCNPARFPTSDYIDRHMDAYTSMSLFECSTSIWGSLTHSLIHVNRSEYLVLDKSTGRHHRCGCWILMAKGIISTYLRPSFIPAYDVNELTYLYEKPEWMLMLLCLIMNVNSPIFILSFSWFPLLLPSFRRSTFISYNWTLAVYTYS